MKTIEINKNGFGLASLFNEKSTKEVLIEQSDLDGKYLEELGIVFEIGDQVKIKTPSNFFKNTYTIYTINIYSITDEKYEGEFI
mgnify:CR=1 FL=1